jgi:hypothetical protein
MLRHSIIFLIVFTCQKLSANEGMWLPYLLESLNYSEMKAMGLKIPADEIYSINKSSLKDAMVLFGGGCSASIIDKRGLLLTNHHCGYDEIQSHSTLADNILKNGFWAKDYQDEKPNPGLSATIIARIEDVTGKVLNGVTPNLSESERQSTIDKNISKLRTETQRGDFEGVQIRPFFEGNQWLLFLVKTYKDVRLVGTPPESIGKFGADTDNWVWPRHTGDFSLFRIYASPAGEPAEYSESNIPYIPARNLTISMNGLTPGQFTMVYGFPGRTQQYISSYQLENQVEIINPIRVGMRENALGILGEYMRKDPAYKLKVAGKQASLANGWKKWKGESLGLKKSNALSKKQKNESIYLSIAKNDSSNVQIHNQSLSNLQNLFSKQKQYLGVRTAYSELYSISELYLLTREFRNLVQSKPDEYKEKIESIKIKISEFAKVYDEKVEKRIIAKITPYFLEEYKKSKGKKTFIKEEFNVWLEKNWSKSIFTRSVSKGKNIEENLTNLLSLPQGKLRATLEKDPIYSLSSNFTQEQFENYESEHNKIQPEINKNQRTYMASQLSLMKNFKKFYPDANGTLRVAYGKVEGIKPSDGILYDTHTYLDGVIQKYIPGDYEFDVDPKLIDLYNKKDFGPYAEGGQLPVCVLASNHTTGGNSGSSVLNGDGHLVGLNFDRIWEGTMSDLNYDITLCRNIMVDIKYVLFVIDKFGDAKHLLKEMDFEGKDPR